jgi:hypothetical protein
LPFYRKGRIKEQTHTHTQNKKTRDISEQYTNGSCNDASACCLFHHFCLAFFGLRSVGKELGLISYSRMIQAFSFLGSVWSIEYQLVA